MARAKRPSLQRSARKQEAIGLAEMQPLHCKELLELNHISFYWAVQMAAMPKLQSY